MSFNGNLVLLVNASNEPQNLTNVYIQNPNDVPPNPFDYVLGTYNQFQPGLQLEINGKLSIGNLLTLQGEFNFTLQLAGPSPGLTITAYAMLSMQPFGSLQVQGLLAVNSQGLFLDLGITLMGGFGGSIGLSFSGTATLELNTSNTPQTYTLASGQTVTIQPGFMLTIAGSVTFGPASAPLITASGSAMISITGQAFTISFNLTMELGGSISIAANGFAGIYNDGNPGLVLELSASIDANIASVIDIDAKGTLLLNTTGAMRTTADGLTIGANSFSLMMKGSVSILEVLSFNASFTILVGGGKTVSFDANGHTVMDTLNEGDWYVSFSAQMSFFGLATLTANGMFDWQGQFAVSLSGDLLLGTHDFGLEGNFSIGTSLWFDNPSSETGIHFDINASASVSARLFGITFASLGVSFDAQINENSGGTVEVEVSVTISIHILFVTVHLTASFDIGTVQLPKPYYLAGDESNPTTWTQSNDGTLYLNTGARAVDRGIGEPDDQTLGSNGASPPVTYNPDEAYIISDAGGNAVSGETINVTAFGHTQTFTGVKRIVDDAADPTESATDVDNESLIVDPGVLVPVEFDGGPNNNSFDDNGSNYAVAYGGGSNNPSGDQNELMVGQAVTNAVLVGGPAYNNITNLSSSPAFMVGGPGNNQITGGPGADIIYGHATASNIVQNYSAASGWTLAFGQVQASDTPYNQLIFSPMSPGSTTLVPGSDSIDGGGGNDFIHAGAGNNAVTWTLAPIDMSNTFLAGEGNPAGQDTNYLYIVGSSNSPNDILVSQPTVGTLQVADQSSTGTTLGYLDSQGFNSLSLVGGGATNNFTVDNLDGSGVQNVKIDGGQNIVDTGQTQTVNDPNNPGDQIQEPVVTVSPHSGADTIAVLGTNGADTFTVVEAGIDQAGAPTEVDVTEADSADTIKFAIIDSVAAQGDTLVINSLNGNDTINAGGMSPTSPNLVTNYPQLINLVEQVGSGTDTLIASPIFNDVLHLGTGNDTVIGGLGQETFLEDPGSTGTDTLIETHDVDFGLYNDKLVMGTALEDGGGSETFSDFENGQYSQYLTEQQFINQFMNISPNFPLNGVANNFAAGSVVEPIDGLFSVVDLTGGAGNNTMVVNSPTNSINVGGTPISVIPFAGSATLDSATNTAGGLEFYVVNIADNNASHIAIADTGGTSGVKVLMVNGSPQADNLTLNAAGGGGFRVGTITESVVSNTFITFSGVERLVLDTQSGNDNVLVNDTAVPTIINFGNGNDNAVVGTVPLIPDTGNRTLDYPDGVPVVNTKAMTNGNSNDLFIMGGSGDDTFEVDHDRAMLYLHGGSGINLFLLKTFLVLRNNTSDPSDITNLNTVFGGSGNNRYEYLQNAPVDIVGGSGYNTIVVVGTPIGDTFVIGNNYIAGAGIILNFTNIQSVEVDGAGGNDTFYVLATDKNLTTTINGGTGDNTINIGGDPSPLLFNPPPYTYTPPPVMVPQPPLPMTIPHTLTLNNLTFDVSLLAYALFYGSSSLTDVVQQLLTPYLAALGLAVPGSQIVGQPQIGNINLETFYNFFTPFLFDPEVEIQVSSVTINYQTTILVPQPPLMYQPPPVTVTPPPYAFQAPENVDASQIQGRVIIDGGQGEQVNGNTVIFHDEGGTPGTGFLRLDTFPQLTSIGQTTSSTGTQVPLWGQNGNLTDTYLTLGGFGLGIPTSGVPAFPGIQLAGGITDPMYDGVELVAADVQNLELLLPNGQKSVDVESVPAGLNLTVDPGSGSNTIDLEASGRTPRLTQAPERTRSSSGKTASSTRS